MPGQTEKQSETDYSHGQVGEAYTELNELAAKHDAYADELEKIKAMLDWSSLCHFNQFI